MNKGRGSDSSSSVSPSAVVPTRRQGFYHKPVSFAGREREQVHGHVSGDMAEIVNKRKEVIVGSPTNLRETYSGHAKVAQVLKWVSTSTLHEGDASSKRSLQEVQAGYSATGLILGSNQKEEQRISLHERLQSALSERPNPDLLGNKSQAKRHTHRLRDFIGEGGDTFIEQAVREAHPTLQRATHRQLHGLRDSLQRVASGDTSRVIDADTQVPKGLQTMDYHAEQRVLDYAAGSARDLFAERDKMTPETKRTKFARLVLAGTRPPCDRCATTERHRESTVPTILRVNRYEADQGPLYPSPHQSVHSRDVNIHTSTQRELEHRGSTMFGPREFPDRVRVQNTAKASKPASYREHDARRHSLTGLKAIQGELRKVAQGVDDPARSALPGTKK